MEQNMEYPFGFGFELMKNPDAMERFNTMSEDEKREVFGRISEIKSREEMRRYLTELGRGGGLRSKEDLRGRGTLRQRPHS